MVSRNVNDGAEVTHFKITGITNGTLFLNDGTSPIGNGVFITFAQGNAGLKFTPASNFFGTASFDVQASLSNSNSGLGGGVVTATITVNAVADTPSVTNAATDEDTQNSSGLVVSRNAADSAEVTHFKITGITNGTLFKNDGTTQINNGDFITFAEGNAGLRFTPAANLNDAAGDVFGFDVQSSVGGTAGGLAGGVAHATITVHAVNDTPSDMGLSGTSVPENSASGTVVGDLTTVDVDLAHEGDSHTYTLVNNAGGRFKIVGDEVQVDNGALLDYEANSAHTIRVRTTDADGATFEKDFVITIGNVNDQIGDREMSYAEDKLTLNLSPTGTYNLRQAGSQAWFLDQDVGLNFSGSYFQNYGGQNEKWIRGVANAFGNPWYFIKPSGQLFAWNGALNQAAGTQVAVLEPIYWAFPQLLHDALQDHLAFAIDQTLGLVLDAGGLYENYGGRHERWLRGTTNQFGNPWYFLTPQGRLYAWDGMADSANGQFLATLDPFYYNQIARVHSALPNQIAAAVLGQGTASARLEVNPVAGFVGHWLLELDTDDPGMAFQDTELFSVTVNQYLPELPAIPNQTMPGAQDTLNVPLNASDRDQGDVVSYFAQAGHLGFVLDYLYDLHPGAFLQPSQTPSFFQNVYGQQEKWLKGVDNDFHNQWYFILPNGDFFAWDGTQAASGDLLAELDPGYYQFIEMLYTPAAGDLARALDQRLGLFVDASGTWENFLGQGERWLRGTGGAWFYITPNGQFFRQGGTLVADLEPIHHAELNRLHAAQAGQFQISLTPNNAAITALASYVGDFWTLIEASDVNPQNNRRVWQMFQVSVT
ncbi:MAG: cadherin domain-containing protein [Gemmataceae bacterium]|nr:cadherin domain-containing protein [Gemmataceae bacterium]